MGADEQIGSRPVACGEQRGRGGDDHPLTEHHRIRTTRTTPRTSTQARTPFSANSRVLQRLRGVLHRPWGVHDAVLQSRDKLRPPWVPMPRQSHGRATLMPSNPFAMFLLCLLVLPSDAGYTCTDKRGFTWTPCFRAHDPNTGAPTCRNDGASLGRGIAAAPVSGHSTAVDDHGVLTPAAILTNYTTFYDSPCSKSGLKFVATNRFIQWPPHNAPSRCVAVLDTNALLRSECPLPSSCHPWASQVVNHTWYGREVTLCVGTGTGMSSITQDGRLIKPDGKVDESWRRVYDITLIADCDLCNTARWFKAIVDGSSYLIFTEMSLTNVVEYRRDMKQFTIINPILVPTTSGQACPAKALDAHVTSFEYWEPPFTASVAHPSQQFAHHNYDNEIVDLEQSISGHFSYTCRDGCSASMVGASYPNFNVNHACINHVYVSKLELPGVNWLSGVLKSLGNAILDAFEWLLENVFDLFANVFVSLDSRIRLTEALICLALSCWHFDNIIKPAIVTTLYLMVTGFFRSTDAL